jgi:hypothetical protein
LAALWLHAFARTGATHVRHSRTPATKSRTVAKPACDIYEKHHIGSNIALMIWFGTLVAVNLQTAFMTPPFGATLFYKHQPLAARLAGSL